MTAPGTWPPARLSDLLPADLVNLAPIPREPSQGLTGPPTASHPFVTDPAEARAILWARCMGQCEKCGGLLYNEGWEWHHRLLRSRGGSWCPCNGLAVHPRCHTQHRDSIHDNPARSTDEGWMVSHWDDPRTMTVDIPAWGNLVLLTCGGTYS